MLRECSHVDRGIELASLHLPNYGTRFHLCLHDGEFGGVLKMIE